MRDRYDLGDNVYRDPTIQVLLFSIFITDFLSFHFFKYPNKPLFWCVRSDLNIFRCKNRLSIWLIFEIYFAKMPIVSDWFDPFIKLSIDWFMMMDQPIHRLINQIYQSNLSINWSIDQSINLQDVNYDINMPDNYATFNRKPGCCPMFCAEGRRKYTIG